MASCPNCKLEWQWNWSNDLLYTPDGTVDIVVVSRATPKPTDTDCQTTLLICPCGCVLVVSIADEFGLTIYNHPKWKDVDWEASDNHYNS